MKYIRTKDGIFERMFPDEEQRISFDHKTIEPAYFTAEYEWVAKKDVIKQSDTIEELCDSEVIVWNDSTPSIWNKFLTKQEFEHLYSSFQRKKIVAVYGAIWTDKGLIYVAKMNDKGELELL